MPKPTDLERHKPRRDGMFERRGTWSEVTVGSKIFGPQAGQRRLDVWEIIDSAAGNEPAGTGMTLWFKARSLEDGREVKIPPQHGTHHVTFVCSSPDDPNPLPPPGEVADAAALDLLLTELGATVLATKDRATGEVVCPNYDMGHLGSDDPAARWYGREEKQHLVTFHGIDASALDLKARVAIHADAHTPGTEESRRSPIPHRHLPEANPEIHNHRRTQ